MSLSSDPELRQLEVLRAVHGGASTYTDIMPRSSYENISSLRRLCSDLVQAGYLEATMRIKKRNPRHFSAWGHGPRATHFRLAKQGESRLAELERGQAPSSVETAAS